MIKVSLAVVIASLLFVGGPIDVEESVDKVIQQQKEDSQQIQQTIQDLEQYMLPIEIPEGVRLPQRKRLLIPQETGE